MALAHYAAARLSLKRSQVKEAIEAIRQAMRETAPEVARLGVALPDFREPAKRLLAAREEGVTDIAPDATGARRPRAASLPAQA